MKVHLTGDVANLLAGIHQIAPEIQVELCETGFPIHVTKYDGPIQVRNIAGKGEIYYAETIHFFRALGLWLEYFGQNSEFDVTETPQFTMSGVMIDCSRNAVPTVAEVKKFLRKMAIMGLNTMLLYTEDTYEVKDYPYFGYMRGKYTEEELRNCDEYAASLGIEMIPCIQTLAHLREAIKWNYARDFRDTDDILLVGEEKTYEFIESCIVAASKPFKTKRIHIGMDEAFQLGLGQYLQKNGYEDHIQLMNKHLQAVTSITEKHGLQPMIWSDMYYPLFDESQGYKDEDGKIRQEVVDAIPDVQLVYWNYYSKDQKHYEKVIQDHKLLGSHPIFAGGAWTWNGIVPNYGKAVVTTEAAIAACKKEGVKEIFVTMWGDNGAETPLSTAYPILQLFAEHTYHENVTLEQVAERFAYSCNGRFADFMTLKYLDETPGVMEDNMNTSMTSKVLLYQDILIGLYDENARGLRLGEHYESLVLKIEKAKRDNPEWEALFGFYEQLAMVLIEKAEIGLKLQAVYEKDDRETMREMLKTIESIRVNVDILRKKHRDLWFATCKPFGWEVIDIRYGGVITRIDSVIYRINKWLNGEIERLEELEEERLRHDGPWEILEGIVGGNVYHRIVTAGNFSL
ncbi:beta-N-acetylhexosaminidase [Bacillus kwashiorkori]|uniref:beta-N-acetylhexosaminidase n=1 Tax=Bacillus kwashiorkori TaxID=1522318 RepID=UPI00078410CB|nr:beta-N-acetylhexosaminidase [Bacillus kwashiorkori]